MNNNTASVERPEMVLDCMETQERLLEEIVESGRELGTALHARKWEFLEKGMTVFHSLLDNFEGMERQRQTLVEALGFANAEDFESALDKDNLSYFRKLKFSLRAGLTKVKARTDFLNKYTQNRLETTEEFVENIMELTRNGSYDSQGLRSVSSESGPMIVSHKS